MKTVALKYPNSGSFTMCRLTGFGTISSDDREQYGTRVSLGNVKTSLDLKESRIVTLEDDKAVKDTKIANLESDKNDKDNRVAALESDKNEKDTKISVMESDMTSLTSRVSTLESSGFDTSDLATKVSLGNLATRVSSLETLGISGISNAVSWTNLTEINLSGEKLVNGDFRDLTKTIFSGTPTIGMQVELLRESISSTHWGSPSKNPYTVTNVLSNGIDVVASDGTGGRLDYNTRRGTNPNFWEAYIYGLNNWSVNSAVPLDQNKLSQGIIKGDGGAVSIQQMFSNPITIGTKLVAKVTRTDIDGVVRVSALRANGSSYGLFNIAFADGYVEFETTETTYGLRLSTAHGTREVSSISLFQGAVSGGTVQAYAGGGLEKISGADGFNAGASSVQKIDGNSDGYAQFQIAQTGKDIKIGLVYADVDYADADPFEITFSGTDVSTDGSVRTTYAQGDFFRIRHYASTNEVKYQKRQTIYSQNPNFVFETATDSNYSYPVASRPLVISLDGTGGLTIGQLYEVYTVRASDQALYLRDLDGNAHGYHGQGTRGVRFEVVEEAGQDYVSFQTSNTLTNGSDLYVDTSFYHVGARINDVTIVT